MLNQNIQKNLKNFVNQAQGVPFREEGADFSGWNCWGLLRQAYRILKGLDLPDFNDLAHLTCAEAEKVFADFRAKFREIPPGREQPLDIILFRGLPVHAGLIVSPGLMLHVEEDLETIVEAYGLSSWANRRLGIYRHD